MPTVQANFMQSGVPLIITGHQLTLFLMPLYAISFILDLVYFLSNLTFTGLSSNPAYFIFALKFQS